MAEYNKKQLAELVAGAFKCSPNEEAFYGSVSGTFLNQDQYSKLDEKSKGDYTRFENPKLKTSSEDADTKAEAAAKKAEEAAAKSKPLNRRKQKQPPRRQLIKNSRVSNARHSAGVPPPLRHSFYLLKPKPKNVEEASIPRDPLHRYTGGSARNSGRHPPVAYRSRREGWSRMEAGRV